MFCFRVTGYWLLAASYWFVFNLTFEFGTLNFEFLNTT
jgi:hypothetical protein